MTRRNSNHWQPLKHHDSTTQQLMASDFTIICLPRVFNEIQTATLLPTLIKNFKTLRLLSLQTNPDSFASNYDREVKFPDRMWEDRLTNPLARTIVALDTRNKEVRNCGKDPAVVAVWVGMAVLIGPRAVDDGTFLAAIQSPWSFFHGTGRDGTYENTASTNSRTIIHAINAVYVSPDVRGLGMGKRLMKHAVQLAELDFANESGPGDRGLCVVLVEKENEAAIALYKASGFIETGTEEYTALNGRKGISIALQMPLGLGTGLGT